MKKNSVYIEAVRSRVLRDEARQPPEPSVEELEAHELEVAERAAEERNCDVCMGFATFQDAIDTPARVSICEACRSEVETLQEEGDFYV